MVDVSFVVVTWNSAGHVTGCLESILAWTRSVSFEVLVVDNGSADGTAERISQAFPAVRLIRAGRNLGFPKACNLAIARACGRHIFLLNPDAQLLGDVAGALVRIVEERDAGAAGPRILESGEQVAYGAARDFPSPSGLLFRLFGLRRLFPCHPLFARENLAGLAGTAASPVAVPCVSGAALLIPRKILDRIGPLDETLPLYLEDLDVCARIERLGKAVYYVPQVRVRHPGGLCSALSPARRLLKALEEGQAPWLYLVRYRGRAAAALFTAVMFAGSLFRLVVGMALFPAALIRGEPHVGRVRRLVDVSRALMQWSLSCKAAFQGRVTPHFDSEPAPGALEDFDARSPIGCAREVNPQ